MTSALLWMAGTVAVYLANTWCYRRFSRLWTSPMLMTPALLIAGMAVFGIPYDDYLRATRPLVWMIGPLTIALAVPIHQHRRYIRDWWPALLAGTFAATFTTTIAALLLAQAFGLSSVVAHSLLPRSISLPFALIASDEVSGTHALTTLFVIASGVVGIVIGDLFLAWLPIKTEQAKGAAMGAVAQVVGVARAHEHGAARGVMASLTMIFSGALTVLIAPLVSALF